jgi:hypothetical protein
MPVNASVPKPVGYAPLELQSLNTPDSLGKIVIYHCPKRGPVNPGKFQVSPRPWCHHHVHRPC